MQMHQTLGPIREQDRGWREAPMVRRTREATPEALGARWIHATDLLAREARSFGERGLTPMERRRTTRRIQVLERVARRAMNDYRLALERELGESLGTGRMVH
jgi:hypothetical protein